MTNYTKLTLMSAILVALLLPAAAQTSGAPAQNGAAPAQTGPESAQRVDQREVKQQKRIANGVENGSLTPSETGSLERKESQINTEEQQMRNADHGNLSAADRAKLQQQQNQVSNQIYQDKHNAAAQHEGTGKIGQRTERQQDRIAEGLKTGQLTGGEAGNLENQEADINREAQKDRAANGGHLTAQEKAKINGQQNHLSKEIHKDKHNNKVRH